MNWEAWKPLATLAFTTTLKFVGGFIVAHGLATQGPGLEALGGAATTAAGALWSWWVQKGHTQAADYLKKLTDTATQAAAIEVAKRMPLAAVTGAAASAKAEAKAIEPAVMAKDAAKAVIILAVLVAGAFAFPGDASAQGKTRPRIPFDPLNLNGQTIAGTTAAPTTPAPIKCDFNIFVNLRPENLETFIKTCVSDESSTLADDTARALQSAENFQPNPDTDAINCLKPGLAIIQAGIIVPAVPAQDAIPATATSPAIPAVAAVPAKSPGLVLLFQKYREFTLAGALTSCQTWVNGPINATAAAGIAGAGTAIAGAALLAPK